jgi:hypothetical protein
MLRTLFWSGFFLLCFACESSPAQQPEEILTDYIQYLHTSDFSAAGALCTPAGAAYVAALETIMIAVAAPPDTSEVKIKSMRCEISGPDTLARCEAVLDDGFETYPESYDLRLRAGRWRVHHEPEDGETTTSEEARSLDSKD